MCSEARHCFLHNYHLSHPRSTLVLLDTGTRGTSGEDAAKMPIGRHCYL